MDENVTVLCPKCKERIPSFSAFCLYCGAEVNGRKTKPCKPKKKRRPNGTGTVYKMPNGKYRADMILYCYNEVDKNGVIREKRKRVTRVFDTAKEAYAALPLLKSEKQVKETLSDLYEIYVESKQFAALSDSQQGKLKSAWRRLAPLHSKNISAVTVDDMQSVIDSAVDTYYPARDMKVMLSHLYELAAQRDLVSSNKTEFIELPEKTEPVKDALNDKEIESLWEIWNTSYNEIAGYCLIMLYCGLRFGELARITTDNIFLDESYMIGGIKTDAGKNREIPICGKIKPVIISFINSGNKKIMQMDKTTFYDSYRDVFNRCGLRKILTPHCLRHTFFTRLAALPDVSPAVIAAAGGHKKFSTTVDNYVHIPLSDKLSAANKI